MFKKHVFLNMGQLNGGAGKNNFSQHIRSPSKATQLAVLHLSACFGFSSMLHNEL